MKQIITILIFSILIIQAKAQDPCYGIEPNNSCCNGIINTDVPYKINTERPSLTNNWNWTSPLFQNNLLSSLFNLPTIYNPYFEANGRNFQTIVGRYIPLTSIANLKVDSFPNLDPRKGWQLISYNFGKDYNGVSYTDVNRSKDPYFIIYNKYSGQLRVLYTVENNVGLQNRINAYLRFPQTGSARTNTIGSGLFAMYKEPVQTLEEESPSHVISPSPSTGATHWTVADYTLQYDPCVCNRESELQFEYKNYATQNIEMSGRGVGIISPFNRTGTNASLFGRDFMLQVAEGFNADGSYILNNADALAKSFRIQPMSFIEKLLKNGMNTVFKLGINAGTAGAASLLGNALAGEITPYMNGTIRNNKDFLSAMKLAGIKGDTINGISLYSQDEIGKALTGYIASGSNMFSGKLFNTDEPGPTNFFINEFEIKMVGTSSGEYNAISNTRNILNPGSLNTKSITPVEYYPLYNEPLGLFALLRRPKIKRYNNNHINNNVQIDIDWKGYVPLLGFFAENTKITPIDNSNKIKYELSSPLEFVLNPSAEIDYEKTKISAAYKIPIVYKQNCGGKCSELAEIIEYAGQVSIGKVVCDKLPKFNFKNDYFVKITDDSIPDDTSYYSTPYLPIEHFNNLRFEYDFIQRACSEFKDLLEGIRISLMIHYVFKPNAYGIVNEHFQTMDYGVEVETTDNFTKTPFQLPQKGNNGFLGSTGNATLFGNNIYSTSQTFYVDSAVIVGDLSTINGAVITIVSKKPVNYLKGDISPNVIYYQGTIYPASTIVPTSENAVKLFCNSTKYRANQYPTTKIAKESGNLKSNNSSSSISLHPNPTSSKTTLTLSGYENTSVSVMIFDLVGREVYTQLEKDITAREQQAVLNTETLQAGTYIVKVFNGTEEKIAKLVILKN